MTTKTTKSKQPEQLSIKDTWLKFITEYRGKSFFKELCNVLANSTGACYVLVGYPDNTEMSHIRTAVLLANGKFIKEYSYPLGGTPCENVVGRSCCYYPSNIQQMFPNDEELKNLSIESYIGLPVQGDDGKPLGLIAIMDKKLIQNPGQIEEGLKAIAPRISKELSKYIKKRIQKLATLN